MVMKDKNSERVLLAHGGGGVLMRELVQEIVKKTGGGDQGALQDSAELEIGDNRIAFTTDSFVVNPIFFPGGDIGELAVNGTVNDLAVSGARPMFLSLSLILEEGLPFSSMEKVLDSATRSAEESGVDVVTGDTKVVERGKADGMFINTSGLGVIPAGVKLSSAAARPGDVVIVSGELGDHGIAVMSKREGIHFGGKVKSDTAPLSGITIPLLEEFNGIRAMRDATRGGLAAVLNEIAMDSDVAIKLTESDIPVSETVMKGCELMGLDPLYIANEGKLVAIVDPEEAGPVVEMIRSCPYGEGARRIGEVTGGKGGTVIMENELGGRRVVDLPYGDLLPRIC